MTDVASGYVVEQNAIEVMRNDLRETATINRKNKRTNELNKHRVALGEVENIEILWDREKLIVKANELKKKPLKISDYRRLQTALLQVCLVIYLINHPNHYYTTVLYKLICF